MHAALDPHRQSVRNEAKLADEIFLGSDQGSTPRCALSAGAGANNCASHRSPRWSVEPLGLDGIGLAGVHTGLGTVLEPIERHSNRHPSPSLAIGRRTHAAGGLQAGAPARSERSTRPLSLNRLHTDRQLPSGDAGTSRGVPASSMQLNLPGWDAGIKEENR